MDQFLKKQFEKIKAAVPLMVEDPWEVMQQGTEVMVQLDAPTMCNENQTAEVRHIAALDLYRAVRAMIVVFTRRIAAIYVDAFMRPAQFGHLEIVSRIRNCQS